MVANTDGQRLVHSCPIPVRWGDMDAYNHVNNVTYARYFEEARVQLLAQMGESDIAGSPFAPVVVTVGCTYLRPVTYPDTLQVDCHVGEPGRSSFMIYYSAYSQAMQNQLCTEGYSKVVWTDRETGKSVPLPAAVLDFVLG